MLNILSLFVDTIHKGGATISILGSTPTTGFAVSTRPDLGLCIPLYTFDSQILSNWVSNHAELLGREDLYIGTWVDCGWVYVDVTQVFTDRSAAISAGRAADQLAIYDLAEGISIDC